MVYRLIAPDWLIEENPRLKRVLEGEFTLNDIENYNVVGYNCYYLPNYPSNYTGTTVDGSIIDRFEWVYVDCDLKSGQFASKDDFIDTIDIPPTKIIDSGHGIHVYWKVSDLDAHSFLRLNRRLCRKYKTDEAVSKIFQLMRLPNTVNTKKKDDPQLCQVIYEDPECVYSCDELDKLLPPISQKDLEYCNSHYEKTYNPTQLIEHSDSIPIKFAHLLKKSQEVKEIWEGKTDDRSKSDYRLGHLLLSNDFSKEEALSVLLNSKKAMSRSSQHRLSYAQNIVDKIWTETQNSNFVELSKSVRDILSQNDEESLKGERIYGSKYFDNTQHGFRLGHVFGLVAGVGVGKTTVSLNLFKSFIELNPQWHHLFVTLEQPESEIAARLKRMFGNNTSFYDKVHILSNENADGSKRDLSLHDIQDYVLNFQKVRGIKIACVVLDHIGILKLVTKNGENQGLMDVCRELKGFARSTNTLFIVQSQSSREKAGDGDIELFKGAAYGTQHFESYMDFLMVVWSPLKRMYDNPACPTVMAYKFVKIRFKTIGKDKIIEDQPMQLYYDGNTETLRPMTQEEEVSFKWFEEQCIQLRNRDKKRDKVPYKSMDWSDDGKSNNDNDTKSA